ncbi:hypothetical protein CDAR_123701 [Caerostris darwini]|uniref:Uncharacterized protein n=1 Tax=Caerostris darwini TaxID=1538125 RepID=A0AAV4WU37_9ARAC|nr:hypothetical protein CDAR_123701 [Caerostris darwini]
MGTRCGSCCGCCYASEDDEGPEKKDIKIDNWKDLSDPHADDGEAEKTLTNAKIAAEKAKKALEEKSDIEKSSKPKSPAESPENETESKSVDVENSETKETPTGSETENKEDSEKADLKDVKNEEGKFGCCCCKTESEEESDEENLEQELNKYYHLDSSSKNVLVYTKAVADRTRKALTTRGNLIPADEEEHRKKYVHNRMGFSPGISIEGLPGTDRSSSQISDNLVNLQLEKPDKAMKTGYQLKNAYKDGLQAKDESKEKDEIINDTVRDEEKHDDKENSVDEQEDDTKTGTKSNGLNEEDDDSNIVAADGQQSTKISEDKMDMQTAENSRKNMYGADRKLATGKSLETGLLTEYDLQSFFRLDDAHEEEKKKEEKEEKEKEDRNIFENQE